MTPIEALTNELALTLAVLKSEQGPLIWQRAKDWTRVDQIATDSTRGGGVGEAASDTQIEDRHLDAIASRYHAELDKLTDRIAADLHRLRRISTITSPAPARTLASKELLAAQVAADGWCISCWRDDQHLHPISKRPNGDPYYTDLCRACGEWKATNGELPPLDVLKTRHAGGRVRVKA